MSSKKNTKTKPARHFYEMLAYHDDESAVWTLALTWSQDGVEMITVTTADSDIHEAMKTATSAMHRAQTDLRHEQLILPDMGDFQIKYWPGWRDLTS